MGDRLRDRRVRKLRSHHRRKEGLVLRPRTLEFKQLAEKAVANKADRIDFFAMFEEVMDYRRASVDAIGIFESMRERAAAIKRDVLANLDSYLEQFADNVAKSGGQVHWCSTAGQARDAVLELCRAAGAKTVLKSKSMFSEELALNDHLEAAGHEVVETDFGEYILQLDPDDSPSHIIAPVIHKSLDDVVSLLTAGDAEPPESVDASSIANRARAELRPSYGRADVGITGANFLIAETGSAVVVTNEGNSELLQCFARLHIVVAPIEKIVPTLDDLAAMLRTLAMSAEGKPLTAFTSLSTGPRRPGDRDGPEQFHVVLVDAGRTEALGTPFEPMLACIRCGACMDHCPVYHSIGGRAYGWVYPGPIGNTLVPQLLGLDQAHLLPSATTSCRRCEEVCPVMIPLTSLMRRWRERSFERKLGSTRLRAGIRLWAFLAARPRLYRFAVRLGSWLLRVIGGRGRISRLPGAWCETRDLPAPTGRPFLSQWRDRGGHE